MLSRRSVFRGTLAVLLFASMHLAGCGKKGDPIPPRFASLPVIAGLSAESVAEAVLLGWSVPGMIGGGIDHFRIVRSETPADQACPGCPQEYRPFAMPKVNDPALRRQGEGTFGYLDTAVTADRFYAYRISACDSRGHCGEPSAPAGLVKKREERSESSESDRECACGRGS